MIQSDAPFFKGGTKRGRNPLKLLGGAGKMAARGAHTLYARSPIRSASGALAPVTPQAHSASSGCTRVVRAWLDESAVLPQSISSLPTERWIIDPMFDTPRVQDR